MCNIALFVFGICTNSWRKGKRSLAILSDRPATTPNILWLETALWCTASMNIRFALKSRSRSRFVREIEQIKCRASEETRCKVTTFLQIMRQYDVKVSKKIRFGGSDADKTEEFGDFEAIVCNMMMSRSAKRWHLHRKDGTLSAERWLLGREEVTRRAQRRQMYGAEATNLAKERVDNGSDFTAARIVIKLCRYNLLTTRIVIKSYCYNLFETRFVIK